MKTMLVSRQKSHSSNRRYVYEKSFVYKLVFKLTQYFKGQFITK